MVKSRTGKAVSAMALALSLALSGCASAPPAASGTARTAGPASAFYFGADLSYVNEMEDCGATWRLNGQVRDPYELFAATGHNLVRVRLWHTPDWTRYSTLDDVRETIRRAKASGQQVLLDFHYSDDWADGDKQWIPKAWENIATTAELAETVRAYTRDTLLSLHREGLMPEMVQVGNETNREVMGRKDWDWSNRQTDWTRNAALLNAGVRGVREASAATGTKPGVMLHIAQPENAEAWFAAAAANGLTDFDYIGLSYYRKWSREDLGGLKATIERLDALYSARVILVETSYPWTQDGADEAANLLGPDTLIPQYPATPEGQSRYMTDITQAVIDAGGVGVVYWEPAWVSTSCTTRWGKGSHWENATYFDFKNGNNALPAIHFTRHPYRWPQTR